MVGEQRLSLVLYAACTAVILAQGSQGTMKYLRIEMFYEYAFKCFYLMVIFYGKIHESLISKKTQESRVGRTRKGQVTELCSRPLRSRRFEIIKKYCSHRK